MNPQTLIEKFIYSLSHDLRAPVSSIQGLVRIADYYPHHIEIHKCLEMIEACTHEMDKRISTLQEFMVNNQRPLEVKPIDPLKLIENTVDKFKNQLGICEIEAIYEVKDFFKWNTDEFCASKILEILISNSIAFHDPEKLKRKITVRIESTEKGSVLEVSDNGKGIPEDQLTRIFDIFYRGTEYSIGMGMGLFLAKSLVEKMDGSITCNSSPTDGTTFRVAFPFVGDSKDEVIST